MKWNSSRTLFLALLLTSNLSAAFAKTELKNLDDFLDRAKIEKRIREEVADLDIGANIGLGDLDLVEGVNLSAKYHYEVEPSYQDAYFTRIDKWDVKTNINAGDIISNVVDLPFSFSVNRNNSFFFVRQFKSNLQALSALPYTPKSLPVNAKRALSQLNAGDFVSMPANLTIAVSAGTGTSVVAPVVLEASASVYYVMSGEFTIQVFKIDESHVRLKLISKRGYDRGAAVTGGASFKFFGIKIVDKQIDRLFDRDLVQLGYSINPGAQFIVDYVFDLKDEDAAEAYNQILSSTLKFKDVVIMNQLDNARELKDKLVSSFEKAEKLFEQDKTKEPKNRRISRIFKGFNNYKGHTNHLKLGLLLTSFVNDRTYTENKLTYTDKNENDMEFFYPTQSRYMETKLGKWFFELKDQIFQNNFGLIPRFKQEDTSLRNPDLGITFERKDKLFTVAEQRIIQKFLIGQIPSFVGNEVDLSEWRSGLSKKDSRIYFQMILKSQGFDYLYDFTRLELQKRLLEYIAEKKEQRILDDGDTGWEKLKDFLFLSKFIKEKQIRKLADDLYDALQHHENNSEVLLKKLIKLNEHGIFDKIGVGFLISLLPEDKLQDLIYIKMDMVARDIRSINYEFGRLNYASLYKELNEVQARLSNRSFDLRLSTDDQNQEQKAMDGRDEVIHNMLGAN